MVLVFEPKQTHSVWHEFYSRARTVEGLVKQLRRGVKDGLHIGWRIYRREYEEIGICTGPVKLRGDN